MATYNAAAVSDAVIAFQKPITLQQGRSLRDNPIAVAEGATGAPANASGWHPYDLATVGDGATGRIWSFAIDGAVAAITSPNFADGYEYRFFCENMGHGATDLEVAVYKETSASWTTALGISTGGTGAAPTALIVVNQPRTTAKGHLLEYAVSSDLTDIFEKSGDSGYISSTYSTAQKILNLRITISSGTFSSGEIYMERRLTYK